MQTSVTVRLLKNSSVAIGGAILLIMASLAILAPWLATESDNAINLIGALQPPSAEHPLGTDDLGRDIYSRILWGARLSLGYSVLTVLVSACVGIALGMFGAYYGRWADEILMRVLDVLLAFPSVLLAVTIVGVLGTGMQNVLLAIGINIIPGFARLTRASVLAVKEHEYVDAARALGAVDGRILFRHILPNALNPLIVQATLRIGTVILLSSGLSFLGLGPQPPTPEWGLMLNAGKDYLRTAPHLSIVPGTAIMLTVLAFNLLGDGLRDVLSGGRS